MRNKEKRKQEQMSLFRPPTSGVRWAEIKADRRERVTKLLAQMLRDCRREEPHE